MEAVVFPRGSRKAEKTVQAADPAKLAKLIATETPSIGPKEAKVIRPRLIEAAKALQERIVPNMTDMQLDLDGRRIRLGIA
jgi:hypothetical protein